MNLGIVIRVHRSKFQKSKWNSISTDALLPKKNRPLGSQLHQSGDHEQQRREHNEREGTKSDVHHPLDSARRFPVIVCRRKISVKSKLAPVIAFVVRFVGKDSNSHFQRSKGFWRKPLLQGLSNSLGNESRIR